MVGSDTEYRAYREPSSAVAERAEEPKEKPKNERGFKSAIAEAARLYVKQAPKGFRDDCSGFAAAVYHRAGAPLIGTARSMWDLAASMGNTHKRKRPDIGDLIFFDNTYDRNGNGRWDDMITHVAVVVDVESDGTIIFAHSGTSKGRSLAAMNLIHPSEPHDQAGKRINDALRRKSQNDPKKSGHLTGELWRGFATFSKTDLTRLAEN